MQRVKTSYVSIAAAGAGAGQRVMCAEESFRWALCDYYVITVCAEEIAM